MITRASALLYGEQCKDHNGTTETQQRHNRDCDDNLSPISKEDTAVKLNLYPACIAAVWVDQSSKAVAKQNKELKCDLELRRTAQSGRTGILWGFVTEGDTFTSSSTHPSIYQPYHLFFEGHGGGGLEPIPADIGLEAGLTLDRSPAHHRGNKQPITFTPTVNSESLINQGTGGTAENPHRHRENMQTRYYNREPSRCELRHSLTP